MQEKLVELGLMEAPADGYFGSDTQEALELFQDYLTEQGDSFAIGETSAASIEVQEKLEGDIPAFLSALSSGSKDSSEVKRLQRRLNSLGYLNRKTIDGAYGSGTQEAIRLFQTNNGLTENGEADEATQRLLFSKDPVEMLTKYRLYVSLDEQRVYVYQLVGKEYVEIKNFACSPGLGNRTPRGVFTNTIPGRRWHYFMEFSIWAQYAFSIEGDILFHSVLFNRKGGSPTYASVYNLGRRASHGCIRLAVENAKWIYENCARGTVVTIN
jgi:peptidoglycan hydrolase-like protein with peptidoglycan-binding domain